jgi:hypothetical protein
MAVVEPMNFRQGKVPAQQIGHRALLEPMPVQPPLAARGQQSISAKGLEDQVPAGAFATGWQALGPEAVQAQFRVEVTEEPAIAPVPGMAQLQTIQLEADRGGVGGDEARGRGRKEFRGRWGPGAGRADLGRALPVGQLRLVQWSQVGHLALDDAPAGAAFVFDDTIIVMVLAVLPSRGAAQKHAGEVLCTSARSWE